MRPEAVSESAGAATFFDSGDEVSVSNSLVQYGELHRAATVSLTSLDEFVGQRGLKVDFVKIDVEGAELQVLRGARNTFAMRPFGSLGLHPEPIKVSGGTLQEIWDLLTSYRMSVSERGVPVNGSDFCSRSDMFDVQLSPA